MSLSVCILVCVYVCACVCECMHTVCMCVCVTCVWRLEDVGLPAARVLGCHKPLSVGSRNKRRFSGRAARANR